ncbi:MAG: hypothetical protein IPM85_11995 [Chitinophagaceae bacterium]|nr:hypothetical protein [Chitinophagaceae bacterium]
MKKILIGLLLVAAATAAYFFLYKKYDTEPVKKATNQELLIGKWKTNSVHSVTDSLQTQYSYDFQKEGNAFRSISDSARADTLFMNGTKPENCCSELVRQTQSQKHIQLHLPAVIA